MKLTPVSCQNCGAALDVPENAKFVTCQFCNSRLSVQHTGSAVFTELLGDLAQKTSQMAGDLEAIRVQNEIAKLDREWELERATHMVRGKNGSVSEPGGASTIIGAGIAVVFGIFWTTMAAQMSGGFALFGVVFIFAAIIGAANSMMKGEAYKKGQAAYRYQRQALEQKLRGME